MTDRTSVKPVATPGCRYFLAEQTGPMSIRLVDGCHEAPEGVAKAAKLHGRIFGSTGPWLMVEITPVPDIDVPINEDAAGTCRDLIDGTIGQ